MPYAEYAAFYDWIPDQVRNDSGVYVKVSANAGDRDVSVANLERLAVHYAVNKSSSRKRAIIPILRSASASSAAWSFSSRVSNASRIVSLAGGSARRRS